MTTGTEHTGVFLQDVCAWWTLGIWVVLVFLYGFYRSLGDAKQDKIRASGPMVE